MNLRRAMGWVLLLLMLLATVTSAATVPPAAVAAERLLQFRVIQGQTGVLTGGKPDLALEKSLTRAELAVILVRAFGREGKVPAFVTSWPYPDVSAEQWHARWISAIQTLASEKGLTLGTAEGTFEPLRPVTRAEALVLTLKLLGQRAEGTGPRWYEPWLKLAAKLQILSESEAAAISVGALEPISRGEAFLYLDRILDLPLLDGKVAYDTILDKTPPVVTMSWEPNPETVQLEDRLSGMVEDDRGIASVTANGRPVKLEGRSFLSELIPFALGSNQLELRVVDLAGNETVKRWKVNRTCCFAARLEHALYPMHPLQMRPGQRIAIDLKIYDENGKLLPPAPYRVVTEMGTIEGGWFTARTQAGTGGVEIWTMNLQQAFNLEILPGPPTGLVVAKVKAGVETYLQAVDAWGNPIKESIWRAQSNGISINEAGLFKATVPGHYFVAALIRGVESTFAVDVQP